jgi:hypothetical protein
VRDVISVKKLVIFRIILLILLAIIILIAAGYFKVSDKNAEMQKSMTDYLQRTYGKDFVVEKPIFYRNEWLGHKNYTSAAYPKDQPDLRFNVIVDMNPGVFKDNYLGTKWSKQGTAEMEKKLREVYGEDFWLENYWISYNDKNVKDLDYPEIMRRYANKTRVDIRYFVFTGKNFDKKFEAERAYKILKKDFIDYKTMQYYFIVGYIEKDKKIQLFNIYESTTTNDHGRSMPDLHKAGILTNWIRIDYLSALSNKYPEVKEAIEILDKFQIRGD